MLAGGGIQGGQVIGSTTDDAMQVKDRPVKVSEFIATICRALQIDPWKENFSREGRPIRLVDGRAEPIKELVG